MHSTWMRGESRFKVQIIMAVSVEKLIECVRQKEILYCSVLRTYKDTQEKEKAWREVAEELGVGDEAGG